ncbi:hypothetical protein JVT61DRAFT_3707 [Boletus reticuloceps]|uniref:Uncharacterized protein n=1 Tax=Boletus reticuloceps TaxID=495285 RepID=A0A8I2YND9_9AGAM|nr:hypothetical protein JVT61DRAFT_3707 [Boletus reticuloceps]
MHVLDEREGDRSLCEIRLTYFPMDKELIAAMPHDVHEEPFNRLRTELDGAINLIPLDFDNGNNKVVVQIRIFSLTDDLRLARPLPYFFLECAYSQGDGDVNRKLKAYVESFLKAIGVMKIAFESRAPFNLLIPTLTSQGRSLAGRSRVGRSGSQAGGAQLSLA